MDDKEHERENLGPSFEEEEDKGLELYEEENHDLARAVDGVPSFLVQMAIQPKVENDFNLAVEGHAILAARAGINTFQAGNRKKEATEDGSYVGFAVVAISGQKLEEAGKTWEDLNTIYQKHLDALGKDLMDALGEPEDACECDEEDC